MTTQGFRNYEEQDPDKIVATAQAKVSVLREEEIKLKNSVAILEKEIARLSFLRDEISESIGSFEEKKIVAEREYSEVSNSLTSLKEEHDRVSVEVSSAKKELESLNESIKMQQINLSEIVVNARKAQEDIDARISSLASDEKDFELRKQKLIEVIATL